jgi:L-histidine Nalpha-methyltransferase
MKYLENQILTKENIIVNKFITDNQKEETAKEIITGLTSEKKYIFSKYFYDETGSNLFEQITRLPEYYPTRTEKSILASVAPVLASEINHTDIIELGSGDCSKISILLNSLSRQQMENIRYITVDVSRSAIIKASKQLSQTYPGIQIQGMVADFMLHTRFVPVKSERFVCFFGSTIGNLDEKHAAQFINEIGDFLNPGDQLLLGLDMVKDKKILENAYNDKKGITAAFNKNILNVVNRHIDSDFDENDFEHLAYYNENKSRIEMHLKAVRNMEISSSYMDENLIIRKGETIHTENSHKFTLKHIHKFNLISGLTIKNIYTDDNRWFSLVHFVKQ